MLAALSLELALLLAAAAPKSPTCLTADARVEKVVSAKVQELKGVEYCQFRKYQTLRDVDGDGKDDFLLIFSVEGKEGRGNDTQQFLGAFLSGTGWKGSLVQVGQRGVRSANDVDTDNGVIIVNTSERREGDAQCCLTGKGQMRFRAVDGRLEAVEK
jgi:hypothetical protein